MKASVFTPALLLLIACGNNNTSTPMVKSDAKTKETKPAAVYGPAVKYGIEGYYTGLFRADTYDESQDVNTNRITVRIDSLDGKNIYGRSIVAGNDRPFTGPYTKNGNTYEANAKEPGNNKYDGQFTFTLDSKTSVLKGSWEPFDKSTPVKRRSYELEHRTFAYNPSLQLSEDMVDMPLPGTFTKDDRAEIVTTDALQKNASTTLLKTSDVENLYLADLEVLRNSIYARHGYSFRNLRMRELFDHYVSWYMPVSTDVSMQLTEIEKKNIELIKRYEKHATKYYDSFGR